MKELTHEIVSARKHDLFFGHMSRGETLMKCRCGFEVTADSREEAEAAHTAFVKKVA